MPKIPAIAAVPAMTLALLASAPPLPAAPEAPDAIYVNGPVVTMDPHDRVAGGVAVKGGRIVAVGDDAEIRRLAGKGTRVTDLGGRALLPGFYAAHDHFPGAGEVVLFKVDLNSPPIGKIRNLDELLAALRAKAAETPKGRWIVGRGYDDTLLREMRHPDRHDLDRVSTEHPIWIAHVSGHLGVANSRALEMAKITKETPQPKGGVIRKDPKTGEPDGVFEECGGLVTRLIPGLTDEQSLRAVAESVKIYTGRGVTTTVIAGGGEGSVADLKRALAADALKIRVVTMTGGEAKKARDLLAGVDAERLRAGAVKLFQDGSIQGFTGWLSAPYFTPFQGDAAYRGYPHRPREELARTVLALHRDGYQIAIHANGDAAIDDVLEAYAAAQQAHPRPDARHRIEHAQTAREDQLDRMKSLGVTPSFFVGHVYYWGDRHRDLFLGPERAARISPLKSALDRGIRFTVHDDTPVTPVNPLQLVWVAANRITTSGKVLGPEQRIPVARALRAVTIDAAWQNFEEATKGSIEPGKLADFVILDRNPLAVDPKEIRDLRVMETIVGGRTVFEDRR